MDKKLLVVLTLSVGTAIAMEPMELTIDDERAMPTDITEQKVIIPIQDQKREIPARFIPLIRSLAGFYVESTPLHMSPITLVSFDTWQLIEKQLERVYVISQGDQQLRNEIIAVYSKLDNTNLIDLIKAIDFLDIPLLKKITLEVAQNNLTLDELLLLPELVRNELIKRKARSIAGPMQIKEVVACKGHEGWVRPVCVTPDGKIVSGSLDKTVRVWNINGQQLAVCRDYFVFSVCITPDGKIVFGSYDNTVRIWDMNGQELAVCRGHEGVVSTVCVTPDGKIVSASWYKTVRIWDINGRELAVCRGHDDCVHSLCVTLDGKIVSGSWDKTVRIWDINGRELAVCKGHEGWVTSVCVTPDGKIVSGSDDKTVRIWSMDGQELAVCRGHEGAVQSICVTPDGKIISGSNDKTVRIWDIHGKERAICRGHEDVVASVCITHDDKIVSGSSDNSVRVWNMKGRELAVCRGHTDEVLSVCALPDAKIISGSRDKTLLIWDVSLLDRLSVMSKKQAQALCKLLKSTPCENQKQKEQCWKKITRILKEEELAVETRKRKESLNSKTNAGKRLRKFPK